MAELSGLCQELGSALLLISHDLAMAARWCDRMAMLDGGRKVEDGPSHQLLTRPQSAVGQRLVASAQAGKGDVHRHVPTTATCCGWRRCAAGMP
jgi:peptide/nickel transport system ATP-binding protein